MEYLAQAPSMLQALAGLIWFRSVPILAFAVLSSQLAWWMRGLWLLAASLCAALLMHYGVATGEQFLALTLPCAVAGAAALATYLVYLTSRRESNRAALFVGIACFVMVLPALALFERAMAAFYILLAFELLFSCYSYIVDGPTAEETPRLGSYLFFVLVDPVLVYPERSRALGAPLRTRASKAGRYLTLGALASLASMALDQVAPALLSGGSDLSTRPWSEIGYRDVVWALGSFALVSYWAHAGAALIVQALMAVAGFDTPERYRYPFLATSPSDFWRRWNIYLTRWLQRYVFLPLSFALKRSNRPWLRAQAQGGAALATLAFCGLLHELVGFCSRLSMRYNVLLSFAVAGVLLAIWPTLGRGFAGWRPLGFNSRPASWLSRALSAAVLLHTALVFGWLVRYG